MVRIACWVLVGMFLVLPSWGCGQAQEGEVVKVGAGGYTTRLPEGAKEPVVLPYVTGEKNRPIPTNQWWSSLVFTKFSNQMFPLPLGVQAHDKGLRIYYPGIGYTANPQGIFTAVMGLPNDLVIGSTIQTNYPDARAERWSDWFVTAAFTSENHKLLLTFGHGSPFVYGTISGGNPTFTFSSPPTIFSGNAKSKVIGVTLHGKSYGLFGAEGSSWEGIGTNRLVNKGKSYFSIALLPDSSQETLALFARYAYNHVTDSKVSWNFDEKTSTLTANYQFTVTRYEGNQTGTLFGMYPHQLQRSTLKPTNYTYQTIRGKMPLAQGDGFTTVTPFQGVLPLLPNYGTSDQAALQKYIDADVATFKPELRDTYWTGKAFGKLATLASISDAVGNQTANQEFRSRLKALLENYLSAKTDADGKLNEAKGVFYYNKAWGTLIGYPASYGSDEALNDHHFHYGYFIRAAAELVRQDAAWGEASAWGGMINLLIRDCANPNRDDPMFPFLRNFDIYEGHSWADGKGDFADGNNNESSSEAMNAWTGMILWGALTGDKKIRDAGIYLYVTEKDAIHNYWFDVHRLYPKEFNRPMVSMLWGAKAVYETWFSADPITKHGINILPVQSGSLYLGAFPDYIKQNIEGLKRERIAFDKKEGKLDPNNPRVGANWGGWGDIILMYQALSQPAAALKDVNFDSQPMEEGNSRANLYYWIHFLNKAGEVDTKVTADTPLYAVFKQGKKRTYVVYSLTNTPQKVTFTDGTVLETNKTGLTMRTNGE